MSRFANLGDRLSAEIPKTDPTRPEDEEDETNPDSNKEKDKQMNEQEIEAAKAEAKTAGHAEGFKAANDRMNAVFASDEYQGREASAHHKLTAAEYSSFTAEQIIASLGKETKVEASALAAAAPEVNQAAADDAARKTMSAAIDENVNSDIVVGSDGSPDTKATSAAGWKKAVALANEMAG